MSESVDHSPGDKPPITKNRNHPPEIEDRLVRLGQLSFADFLLLEPCAARAVATDAGARADLGLALANAPHIEVYLRRIGGPTCEHAADVAPELSEVRAAQERLVRRFALELLKHKSPPLYDCLPWHDIDLSHLIRRTPVWKTRVLLAGEGAVSLVGRFPRTAGVTVIEPLERLRRYVEEKARLDRIRRVRVVRTAGQETADLAVIGSASSLLSSDLLLALAETCPRAVVVENCPLTPRLDESFMTARGFVPGTVEVRSLGPRPCWQK